MPNRIRYFAIFVVALLASWIIGDQCGRLSAIDGNYKNSLVGGHR